MEYTIVLDCDGVLADFVGALAKGFEFDPEIVTEHDLRHVFGEKWPHMVTAICSEGWCSQVPMYEGAQELYKGLAKLGRVIIATSPWDSETWCCERTRWIRERFPKPNIVFARDKHDVRGDVLIEDSAESVEGWIDHLEPAILVDRPWNKHWNSPYRVCASASVTYGYRAEFSKILEVTKNVLKLCRNGGHSEEELER